MAANGRYAILLSLTALSACGGPGESSEDGEAPARERVVHVTGTVADWDGTDALDIAFLPHALLAETVTVRTTSAHAFEAELVGPRAYTAVVRTSLSTPTCSLVEILAEVAAEETVALELRPAPGAVTGTVADRDRRPLAGVPVALASRGGLPPGSLAGRYYSRVLTDAGGRFELRHVPDGEHELVCGGPANLGGADVPFARAVERIEVRAGHLRQGVDFRLAPGGKLTGLVLDSEGRPAAGAWVFVWNAAGDLLERVSRVRVAGDGSFVVAGVADGEYAVMARKDGRVTHLGTTQVSGGLAAEDVRLVLAPGGHVEITVRVDGVRTGAEMAVVDGKGRPFHALLTPDFSSSGPLPMTGERMIGPLPDGKYTARAVLPGGEVLEREVYVETGATANVLLAPKRATF